VSKWVIEENDGSTPSQFHVLPVDEWGVVVPPHVRHDECKCAPSRDPEQPRIVIHHDPERGGFNA
jgi:hypothetical protein